MSHLLLKHFLYSPFYKFILDFSFCFYSKIWLTPFAFTVLTLRRIVWTEDRKNRKLCSRLIFVCINYNIFHFFSIISMNKLMQHNIKSLLLEHKVFGSWSKCTKRKKNKSCGFFNLIERLVWYNFYVFLHITNCSMIKMKNIRFK